MPKVVGVITKGATFPGIVAWEDVENSIRYIGVRLFASSVSCTTGDAAGFIQIPPDLSGMDLVYAHLRLWTPGTTNTMDMQLRRGRETNPTTIANVDMLSTVVTVDSGEYGSHNAATAYVINASNDDVLEDDYIAIDIDAIHTTAAKGAVAFLGFQFP